MPPRIAIVDPRPDLLVFLLEPKPDLALVDFEPRLDLAEVLLAIEDGLRPRRGRPRRRP